MRAPLPGEPVGAGCSPGPYRSAAARPRVTGAQASVLLAAVELRLHLPRLQALLLADREQVLQLAHLLVLLLDDLLQGVPLLPQLRHLVLQDADFLVAPVERRVELHEAALQRRA